MRSPWSQVAARWAVIVLMGLAVAVGVLWVLSWAIMQNDADRTPSAYQDQP